MACGADVSLDQRVRRLNPTHEKAPRRFVVARGARKSNTKMKPNDFAREMQAACVDAVADFAPNDRFGQVILAARLFDRIRFAAAADADPAEIHALAVGGLAAMRDAALAMDSEGGAHV